MGSGPSGVYTAEALLKARPEAVLVDIYDRLPAPYGLVRYGVAPDHLKIKSVSRALQKTFEHPAVRFFGDVDVGVRPTVDELRAAYDVVVYAFGAAQDRRLGVPGEDLHGSFSAVEFVAWYSGHPDAEIDRYTLDAESVVVVGAGNVAIDVARILAKPVEALRPFDIPDQVLDVLAASKVTDVHLVARRGPAQAKFTTKELREMGEIDGCEVVLDPDVMDLDEASAAEAAAHKEIARNVEVMREFSSRTSTGAGRRLHFHFWASPTEILGGERVEAVRCARTSLSETGSAVPTGESYEIPAQMVLRSVGYRGAAIPGVPLDERAGVIPNDGGRVLRDGAVSPGEYAVGWIKRGPTGVIGTNRSDAADTVAAILEDWADGSKTPSLSLPAVSWEGWLAIDAAEAAAGAAQGRDRVKLARWEELRAAAADR
ncbi:MAG TPA: FAD-dependent oxidoreductase [Mycobacteriales bacterium]